MRKQVLAAFVSFVVALALVFSSACKSKSSPVAPTPPNQLRVLTIQLPPAVYGQLYSARLEAAGGQPPYQWTADGLPAGLFVEPSGSINGFLASYGQLSFSVRVTDQAGQNASAVVTLQSLYEPLPARHSLGDASEKLWAELMDVQPPRGSSIVIGPFTGPPDCSKSCFRRVLKLGFEGVPNPNVGSLFQGFYSDDGQNPRGERVFFLGTRSAGVVTWTDGNDGGFMPFPDFAPRYLLVRGSYPGSCLGGDTRNCGYPPSQPGEGSTNFVLDYKPKS